ANVCARDRKMVHVAAVTSGARRAFANQPGLLPEVWLVLDTPAAKAPLLAHRFHCPPLDKGRVAPARFEQKLLRCVALRAEQFQKAFAQVLPPPRYPERWGWRDTLAGLAAHSEEAEPALASCSLLQQEIDRQAWVTRGWVIQVLPLVVRRLKS